MSCPFHASLQSFVYRALLSPPILYPNIYLLTLTHFDYNFIRFPFQPYPAMKLLSQSLTILTTTLALLSPSFAETTDYIAEHGDTTLSCIAPSNQTNDYWSIVGVQGTGIHPRLEIRDLEKQPEMWNLFIQAMEKFQSMDQKEKKSWFQIAGMCRPNAMMKTKTL